MDHLPDDGARLGVLFFHKDGFSTACGRGTIALGRLGGVFRPGVRARRRHRGSTIRPPAGPSTGRLARWSAHIDGRIILLADEVRRNLRAYLDYRSARWPHTANTHLFITVYSANRTTPASTSWISDQLGRLGQRLREDRILDEIQATGGDLRKLCDLFGIQITGAMRYVATVSNPSLTSRP